jgi:hypothetical protein
VCWGSWLWLSSQILLIKLALDIYSQVELVLSWSLSYPAVMFHELAALFPFLGCLHLWIFFEDIDGFFVGSLWLIDFFFSLLDCWWCSLLLLFGSFILDNQRPFLWIFVMLHSWKHWFFLSRLGIEGHHFLSLEPWSCIWPPSIVDYGSSLHFFLVLCFYLEWLNTLDG